MILHTNGAVAIGNRPICYYNTVVLMQVNVTCIAGRPGLLNSLLLFTKAALIMLAIQKTATG